MYLCKFGGNPPTRSGGKSQIRLIFTVLRSNVKLVCFSFFAFRFSLFVFRFSLFVFRYLFLAFRFSLFVFRFSFSAFGFSFFDIRNRAEYRILTFKILF